nr:atp synthase mitochondrial f1 complex assembly factor 2 [Quercus suber]
MPMSFMIGSIMGKRFYNEVKVRESEDGVGWSVMLDYRTLKTPSKRPLKLPTLPLAKAIATEWEYQYHSSELCNSWLRKTMAPMLAWVSVDLLGPSSPIIMPFFLKF